MKFKNSDKRFSISDIVKYFVKNKDKLTSIVIDVKRKNNKVFILTINGCDTKFSKTFNYRFIDKKCSKFKFEEHLIMNLLLELSSRLFKNGIDFCICFPVTNFPTILKPRPDLNDLLLSNKG